MNLKASALPAVLPTHHAASFLNRAHQILCKWACLDCAKMGIRPLRIHGRLAWRVGDLQKLLEGGI